MGITSLIYYINETKKTKKLKIEIPNETFKTLLHPKNKLMKRKINIEKLNRLSFYSNVKNAFQIYDTFFVKM